MSKKLRNLALLGGLGAAAAMAMRGKGKEEESKDTTGDASAGMAKDRLSDFRGKSGDVNLAAYQYICSQLNLTLIP